MIKCGKRPNLKYPIRLIIFTLIRRIVEFLINTFYNFSPAFLYTSLIFFSELLGGLIYQKLYSITQKQNLEKNIIRVELIHTDNKIIIPDTPYKIFFLMFICSFFDFFGSIMRKFLIPLRKSSNNDIYEAYIRNMQILFSSILCLFLLNTKVCKHQLISLIIISVCIIIVITCSIIIFKNFEIILLLLVCISSFQRSYLDTIQKYLFEVDYMNPFKVLIVQGGINILFFIPFCFYKMNLIKDELKEFQDLFNNYKLYSLIVFILLFILYFISSLYKNAYIAITIKIYSPMTRALSECCLDWIIISFFLIKEYYNNFKDKEQNQKIIFFIGFIIIIIFTFIMNFFAFIYNEIFILYLFGMEYDTHVEIMNRAKRLTFIETSFNYRITENSNEDNENNNIHNDSILQKNDELQLFDSEFKEKLY